ncbi:MAG: antirestriction protein ArdA [Lachnospiraceae bacterium]|nr:antirestriction protein ArdA [Lachnospiraceae bacterium]
MQKQKDLTIEASQQPKYFEVYEELSPIIPNNKEWVSIYQKLYDEANHVHYEIAYNPTEQQFMFIDTLADRYDTYFSLSEVSGYMSKESIDKFVSLQQSNQDLQQQNSNSKSYDRIDTIQKVGQLESELNVQYNMRLTRWFGDYHMYEAVENLSDIDTQLQERLELLSTKSMDEVSDQLYKKEWASTSELKGYQWTHYNYDYGSGGLKDPTGKSIGSYDLGTREIKFGDEWKNFSYENDFDLEFVKEYVEEKQMDVLSKEIREADLMEKKFELSAYVTNLGKYNEGELCGEWVQFPTTQEKMQGVFERIGINEHYQEYFITDYNTNISNLTQGLGEYERIDNLNYLATRINEMDSSEFDKFKEILSSNIDLVQPNGIEAYINLTYNLDTYEFIPEVNDYYDLGHYLINDGGSFDLSKMGELSNYIDYEAYGRDYSINDSGYFSNNGYISYTNEDWSIEFDGKAESIPSEYRLTGTGRQSSPMKSEQLAVQSEPEQFNLSDGIDEARLNEIAEEMMLEEQAFMNGPELEM